MVETVLDGNGELARSAVEQSMTGSSARAPPAETLIVSVHLMYEGCEARRRHLVTSVSAYASFFAYVTGTMGVNGAGFPMIMFMGSCKSGDGRQEHRRQRQDYKLARHR